MKRFLFYTALAMCLMMTGLALAQTDLTVLDQELHDLYEQFGEELKDDADRARFVALHDRLAMPMDDPPWPAFYQMHSVPRVSEGEGLEKLNAAVRECDSSGDLSALLQERYACVTEMAGKWEEDDIWIQTAETTQRLRIPGIFYAAGMAGDGNTLSFMTVSCGPFDAESGTPSKHLWIQYDADLTPIGTALRHPDGTSKGEAATEASLEKAAETAYAFLDGYEIIHEKKPELTADTLLIWEEDDPLIQFSIPVTGGLARFVVGMETNIIYNYYLASK